ncbi:MAG: ABC transporter substrate-binding protein, partial [Anaerolineae bacterium]
MSGRLSRRGLLRGLAILTGGGVLAACGSTPTPQVIEKVVTSVVEKEVTKIVEGTAQVVKETVVVEKEITAAAAPAEAIELRASHWWGSFMTPAFTAAMKSAPNVSIVDENADWGTYETKILTSFAAGVAPDIFLVDAFWFGDFWNSGRIAPLGDLMADKDNTKWGVDPKVENTYDGNCYGLSVFYPEQMTLWINKEIADKDGVKIPELGDPEYDTWDWDKFVEVLTALTHRKADGTVEQWGITCIGSDLGGAVTQTVHQNGGRWFDTADYYGETKFTVDTPEVQEACQSLVDLVYKHKVMMPRDVASALSPQQSWSGGQFVAMTFEWGNPQNIVEHPFVYTHLPWPTNKDKTLSMGGNCWSLNLDSPHLQEAVDAIWFLTTDDIWCQYMADGWNNSPYDTRAHIDRMGPGVNKN